MKFSHLLIALIVPIFIQSNAVFGQPLVTGVTPNRGSTGGGTLVTITGSDFTDATAVTFGGRAAESFTVVNNGTIQAQTPVGTIGAAQVAVASSSGISSANSPDDLFVYVGVWFAYETNADDGTVTVVNITNNTAGFIIPVGNQPNGIAITPDAKTAYVVNFGSNNVTPIDLATNTPEAPIPVGAQPVAIAISQTVSNNGGPNALLSRTIEVSVTLGEPIRPPGNLRGRQRKDESATQTDFVNILTWEAPTAGPAPVSYRILSRSYVTNL